MAQKGFIHRPYVYLELVDAVEDSVEQHVRDYLNAPRRIAVPCVIIPSAMAASPTINITIKPASQRGIGYSCALLRRLSVRSLNERHLRHVQRNTLRPLERLDQGLGRRD